MHSLLSCHRGKISIPNASAAPHGDVQSLAKTCRRSAQLSNTCSLALSSTSDPSRRSQPRSCRCSRRSRSGIGYSSGRSHHRPFRCEQHRCDTDRHQLLHFDIHVSLRAPVKPAVWSNTSCLLFAFATLTPINVWSSRPKAGAVCGNAARADLWSECGLTGIPTPTNFCRVL